jgi:short-subunit dehydrogenase
MPSPTFRLRYGPWAVVVGASQGLGAAFGRELASRGIDLVLVARRKPLLEVVAARLRREHGVRVKALALDAATPEGLEAIVRRTRALDVGLLVCNAAFAPIGPFLDLAPEELDRMLDLNCRAAVRLAHAFGRRLLERGRGGIVFQSSMAGLQGAALVAHYAATKAYLRVLAEGLWSELGQGGVDVVACCAGRVRTPGFERSAPRRARSLAPPVMSPLPVVRAALSALGREPVVIPGRLNRLAACVTQRFLPRRSAVALVSSATRAMYPSRRTGSRRSARRGGASG